MLLYKSVILLRGYTVSEHRYYSLPKNETFVNLFMSSPSNGEWCLFLLSKDPLPNNPRMVLFQLFQIFRLKKQEFLELRQKKRRIFYTCFNEIISEDWFINPGFRYIPTNKLGLDGRKLTYRVFWRFLKQEGGSINDQKITYISL